MDMIITLDEYKAISGIVGTARDSQIEALIPLVESDYLSIRNKDFDRDDDGSIKYPEGAKLTAAEMISFRLISLKGAVGLASESIGDFSHSFSQDMLKGYPRSIINKIKRYARAL